jgi:hypothetical protein
MANWSREFDESIPLPSGQLVTLKDAAEYV